MLEKLPALHDVGQIQPAGTVLIFDFETELVTAVSANLDQRVANWSVDAAIGTQAEDVLGSTMLHDVRNASALPSIARIPEPLGVTNLGVNDIEVSVFHSGQHIVVEFCDAQTEPSALSLVKDLVRLDERMRKGVDLIGALTDVAALIRIMSGYDRVQAVALRPDGRAEVIAESRRSTLEATLGEVLQTPLSGANLHLPPYRIVADAESDPVSVLSQRPDRVDLALCQTIMPKEDRSRFLSEIGMRSEMILPIRTSDRLWGALIFQSSRPRCPNLRFKYISIALAPLLKEMLVRWFENARAT